MKNRGKRLFSIALGTLIFSSLFTLWQVILPTNTTLRCSSKAIMHFEDTEMQSVNANIHFNFAEQGKGSIIVEGYTHSTEGELYLQRYVNLTYQSHPISTSTLNYRIKSWVASKSSIDQSPDVIFDYFMREMSDSHDGLLLIVERINPQTLLLSSLSSPLFICTLKPTTSKH